MPRKQPERDQAVSSEIVPQDLTDLDQTGILVDETEAAVERAAKYVLERAYGPRTVELVQYIAARALDSADLNVIILEQMSERLLAAKSPLDILTPFDPSGGRELYGKVVEILSTEFLESDYAEGFPWYVSVQLRRSGTGPTEAFTIGGEKLVLQCGAMDKANMWPCVVKIHQAEEATKSGFYPLELRPPQ